MGRESMTLGFIRHTWEQVKAKIAVAGANTQVIRRGARCVYAAHFLALERRPVCSFDVPIEWAGPTGPDDISHGREVALKRGIITVEELQVVLVKLFPRFRFNDILSASF